MQIAKFTLSKTTFDKNQELGLKELPYGFEEWTVKEWSFKRMEMGRGCAGYQSSHSQQKAQQEGVCENQH